MSHVIENQKKKLLIWLESDSFSDDAWGFFILNRGWKTD